MESTDFGSSERSWEHDIKPDIHAGNGTAKNGESSSGNGVANASGHNKRSMAEDSAKKKRMKRSSGKACVYCRRR
jgi:hypothetical protein